MIVLQTLGNRWYAWGFLVLFGWSASRVLGWPRTLRLATIAAVVQLAAELSSTRNGFPYGSYSYTAHTRLDEIYLWNVPLFVPLTFGVVVWAARGLAGFALPRVSRFALILPSAVTAATLDLIIDPMTLRGRAWFLGDLYAYHAGGGYFDVPWTNFLGWMLVSAVILTIEAAVAGADAERRETPAALTPAAAIALFFVVVAAATGYRSIALAGFAIATALAVATLLARRTPAFRDARAGE